MIQELSIAGLSVPVLFGRGALDRLGQRAAALGGKRVLLVSDPGIASAGHVARAATSLRDCGAEVRVFDEAEQNPTTISVDRCVASAREHRADLLVGLGGGSSMDCAKGCNFILTNGGRMADYWGIGKATKPMLPLIAVPTTAGTGSEAQSFALITDPETHRKMACGDKKALPRLAILDADLTATQPPKVAAATGIDAVAHAVESAGCLKRNETSQPLSREAWQLLDSSFDRAMRTPDDVEARQNMLLGAHLAGAAIEHSMLGAAHAAANPLTANFGIVHGAAVGMMLPHVIRFNASGAGATGDNPYSRLDTDAEHLARRIEDMLDLTALSRRLTNYGIAATDIPHLAALATNEWTAQFNPRPMDEPGFVEIYQRALK